MDRSKMMFWRCLAVCPGVPILSLFFFYFKLKFGSKLKAMTRLKYNITHACS